jgi:hypothetical protein
MRSRWADDLPEDADRGLGTLRRIINAAEATINRDPPEGDPVPTYRPEHVPLHRPRTYPQLIADLMRSCEIPLLIEDDVDEE